MAAGPDVLRHEYDNMLACIRCGLCSSVCPTYQETLIEEESPRGRIAIARALTEGHLTLTADLLKHMDTCLMCEACTAICPTGVRMEGIGEAVRSYIEEQGARPENPVRKMLKSVGFRALANMGLLRSLSRGSALYQMTGMRTLAQKTGLLKLFGLGHADKLMPTAGGDFFEAKGQTWKPQGTPRARVAVLAGCVMSTMFADTDRNTVEVLTINGCEVVAPKAQGCCGALHARDLKLDAIIVNAAGCGAAMKGYARLLADDPAWAEEAAEFTAKVKDATEFLDALGLVPPTRAVNRTVAYQEACHLAHAQGIKAAPRRLLRAIPGLTLVEMAESDRCCGSAGVYNLLQPEMSTALQQRKVRNIAASGAQMVVTTNPGCLLQIQAGLETQGVKTQIVHIIDLLWEAYQSK
ncbi:MAG: (Fe-S)-binding protein [Chloroflexi bacterium]|nr:(Fe-S)-binding protein [Chloroflexota bacterium]